MSRKVANGVHKGAHSVHKRCRKVANVFIIGNCGVWDLQLFWKCAKTSISQPAIYTSHDMCWFYMNYLGVKCFVFTHFQKSCKSRAPISNYKKHLRGNFLESAVMTNCTFYGHHLERAWHFRIGAWQKAVLEVPQEGQCPRVAPLQPARLASGCPSRTRPWAGPSLDGEVADAEQACATKCGSRGKRSRGRRGLGEWFCLRDEDMGDLGGDAEDGDDSNPYKFIDRRCATRT